MQVYYPTASMDPSRFQYYVEGTDRWGNLPEAGLPVGCEVRMVSFPYNTTSRVKAALRPSIW